MKSAMKGLALLLLIICGVWLAVMWHWQRTMRDVGTADVVYWLIVLPLLLFAVVLLLRGAWQTVVRPAGSAATSLPAGAPAADAMHLKATPATRPAWLLASALHLPGANTPSALDEALREQTAQPEPDAELTGNEGLPLHTARLPELDLNALAEDESLLSAQPRTLRALAALKPALDELASALPLQLDSSMPATASMPVLNVLLHLPDDTPADDRDLAQGWMLRRLQANAPGWAQTVQLRVVSGPVLALWQQVEQAIVALTQEGKPELLLLAAAHSELDRDLLASWGDQGLLFNAQRRPRGRMPGEGAAALLIAPPGASLTAEPMAGLHRAAWALRSQPVDAPGRVSSETLESLIGSLLEAANLTPAQIPALTCDADRHGVRNGELFGAVIARLPQLDALQDVRALGAACGHQGAVGLLACIALAAHAVSQPSGTPETEAASPCLVLNLDDPSWRLGLLVSAPPPAHSVT